MKKRPNSRLAQGLALAARGLALAAPAAIWISIPTLALAAEGGLAANCLGNENPLIVLACKGGNFFILMAILVYFARKPIAALLRGGAESVRSELETAREAARAAEAKLAEQKSRIENLEADLTRLREEAREESRTESARLVEEARAQAERIKTQIQLQVEQEFNKARAELKRQLADQTVQLAEARIEAQMDAPRREALAMAAIQQMGDRR